MRSTGILFVCLGNICRSPTAEGVFRRKLSENPQLAAMLEVDSAGTAAYHVGNPPDQRSATVAARRGYDLSPLRARAVAPEDFDRYDYVLAMDHQNLSNLKAVCPAQYKGHLSLFLDFAGKQNAAFFDGAGEYLMFPTMQSSPIFQEPVWPLAYKTCPGFDMNLAQVRDLLAWLLTALGQRSEAAPHHTPAWAPLRQPPHACPRLPHPSNHIPFESLETSLGAL